MTYAGPARHEGEIQEAINLAALVFQSGLAGPAGMDLKRFYTLEVPGVSESDVIVVEHQGSVAGTTVLIDRRMVSGGITMPVTYVTSVCIDPKRQGGGLSRVLMTATRTACLERGAAMIMLIARRSVDGFYGRFGFWGLSSYNRLVFRPVLATPFETLRPADASDIAAMTRLYGEAYGSDLGRHERNHEAWRYLLDKMTRLGREVLISRDGYLIASGERIFELALAPTAAPSEFLSAYARARDLETLEISMAPTHPLAAAIGEAGLHISRECTYGGHMGAVGNLQVLLDVASQRVARHARSIGLPAMVEEIDGIRYDWDGQRAVVSVTGHASDYWTTSRLFGAAQLSTAGHIAKLDPLRPFNILMADQL